MTPDTDIDYLVDTATRRAHEYGVPDSDWLSLLDLLAPLRVLHPATYAHSLRVGIYAGAMAEAEHHNASFALGAGCAHDIGKIAVSRDVLNADPFTDDHFKCVQVHPTAGFDLLFDEHPLLALVAGLHHQFQPRGYGIGLDNPEFSRLPAVAQRHVLECVDFVTVCDYYDSATTRRDRDRTSRSLRQEMEAHGVPSQRIDWLFAHDLTLAPAGV